MRRLVFIPLMGLWLSGCAGGGEPAAISIPLHDAQVSGPAAPEGLTVVKLEGPDGPQPGDSWLLEARAVDPGGPAPIYRWAASSGELSAAEGAQVRWTATEAIGRVELSVTAVGAGGEASATLAARVTAQAATGPISDDLDTLGYYCALAFDDGDDPRLVFRDDTHPSVYYAAWNGSSWDVELIEGYGLGKGGDVGYHAQLAVDGAGHPHAAWFSYYAGDPADERTLVYATRGDAGWSITDLGGLGHTASFPLALRLNPATLKPEILYQTADRKGVELAVCTGDCTSAAAWRRDRVYTESRSLAQYAASDVAYPGGLDIAADGTRHVTVAYEYRTADYFAGMLYLSGKAAFSAPETLATNGAGTFVDVNGARLHLGADGGPLAMTQYGIWQRLAPSSWRLSPYDGGTANHIYRFDLAVDAGTVDIPPGKLYFTYANGTTLELAETDERGYFRFSYLGSITGSARARTAVAVDSTGAPHVCWSGNGDVQYR